MDAKVIRGLVEGADVSEGALVVDVGAGNGLITAELSGRGARVIAIEKDAKLVRRLQDTFARDESVDVVAGDVLAVALPGESIAVVANIPFGITTKILRRLMSTESFVRGDVIVQKEVASKRTTKRRGSLLNMTWEPWFRFALRQSIPATAFRPRPSVDAAVLVVERLDDPLLEPGRRDAYERFLTGMFTARTDKVAKALAQRLPPNEAAAALAAAGVPKAARPPDVTVEQWVRLFRAASRRR